MELILSVIAAKKVRHVGCLISDQDMIQVKLNIHFGKSFKGILIMKQHILLLSSLNVQDLEDIIKQ